MCLVIIAVPHARCSNPDEKAPEALIHHECDFMAPAFADIYRKVFSEYEIEVKVFNGDISRQELDLDSDEAKDTSYRKELVKAIHNSSRAEKWCIVLHSFPRTQGDPLDARFVYEGRSTPEWVDHLVVDAYSEDITIDVVASSETHPDVGGGVGGGRGEGTEGGSICREMHSMNIPAVSIEYVNDLSPKKVKAIAIKHAYSLLGDLSDKSESSSSESSE